MLLLHAATLSHGNLLRATITSASRGTAVTACSENAPANLCAPTAGLQIRSLIPRSGNTGACAVPPGCELGCDGVTGSLPGGPPCANLGTCDHCALEKTAGEKAETVPGKW